MRCEVNTTKLYEVVLTLSAGELDILKGWSQNSRMPGESRAEKEFRETLWNALHPPEPAPTN
jgi:hypothetical protein